MFLPQTSSSTWRNRTFYMISNTVLGSAGLARKASMGKQIYLILLDFSKAFDKVNHSKLILKLQKYGIRGNVLGWVRAFLDGRSQRVVVEDEESGSVPVTAGVPQGSFLRRTLFLIFINDLPEEI